MQFLNRFKRKSYDSYIEESSKFWTFELDDYSADELIHLERIAQIYTDFALIGCHYDENSGINYLHGFIILKKRRTRSNLESRLAFDNLSLDIAHGHIQDQIDECLGGKSIWRHGDIVFKSNVSDKLDLQLTNRREAETISQYDRHEL